MNRIHYGEERLLVEFKEIGEKAPSPITVYLFGGGAMVFRKQKPGTKDLDLAFLSQSDYVEFTRALEKSGFHKVNVLEPVYIEMETASMWEKPDGFRLDLFVRFICKKLEVNSAMVQRSETFKIFNKLTVQMLSNEDLILLKGITERDRDEDDIADIIRSASINWEIVLNECASQSKTYPWYGSLFNKFFKIKEKHDIDSPIMDTLEARADRAALVQFYKDKLEEGKSHEEIIARLKKEGFTQKEIAQLETDLQLKNGQF